MSVELKPCPFCGETYIIKGDFDFRGDGPDKFPNDVVCSGCGIGYCGHDFKGQGDAAVVNAWNRRADAAEIDRLRGVLGALDEAFGKSTAVAEYCGPNQHFKLKHSFKSRPDLDAAKDALRNARAALAEGNGQEGGV